MISGADLIEVESVSAEKDFVLQIVFSNGQKKKVDLSNLLKNPPPVFSSPRDQNEFKKVLVCTRGCTAYSDGTMKLILSPTDEKYKTRGFHRKQVGLNHLAFSATSAEEVNKFHKSVLIPNSIACLYEQNPSGNNSYYAVFFEDPDRIKIELVFAPGYCEHHHWTNQIESDYEPSIN